MAGFLKKFEIDLNVRAHLKRKSPMVAANISDRETRSSLSLF